MSMVGLIVLSVFLMLVGRRRRSCWRNRLLGIQEKYLMSEDLWTFIAGPGVSTFNSDFMLESWRRPLSPRSATSLSYCVDFSPHSWVG